MKTEKIVFITFLNDYSGSPNILSVVIKGLSAKGYSIDIFTNRSEGFLSNIPDSVYHYVTYCWTTNKSIVALYLLISQIQLFFKILFFKKCNTVFYINTVTPIGAVWACKMTGKKYIYHVHENMQQNKSLYKLYRWTYKFCNTKTIFVSNYLKSLAVNSRDCKVVYNSLDSVFFEKASSYVNSNLTKGSNILMVASLRTFKGVYEFVELAKLLPQYSFEMVLNATDKEVLNFIKETLAPKNILIHSVQKDLHPFYRNAKLLLQLSHPKSWIETFGLTILEAMVYGIPAIVPNVGGPVELIDDGINGFLINPLDIDTLEMKVKLLMDDDQIYNDFSIASLKKSKQFELKSMINQIEEYIMK